MPVRRIRIALIEDSLTVRFFYKKVFEKAGFQVLEADNAKLGWKIIHDQRPDIIVLDMMMPEIPGIELLKRIRSFEFSKHIPVIVLTAVKDDEQVAEIFKHGANHYVLKGMDSPELMMDAVTKLLKEIQEKMLRKKLEAEEEAQDENTVSEIEKEFFWF